MKLRNKKTGEIVEPRKIGLAIYSFTERNYNSLAELNEEWEDYEEPKEYWHIAELCGGLQRKQDTDNGEDRFNKQIGNYFESEEEAEKAVEKLKALKRLKDKGFRFVGWRGDVGKHHLDGVAWYEMRLCGGYNIETADDLEALFGPEEKE